MNKYTIDYNQEDLIEIAVKEWVLGWCKQHHPEVFERAREFIRLTSKKEHEEVV